MVREGQTVVITDRDVPVARIEPVEQADLSWEDRWLELERKGVIKAPKRKLDPDLYLKRERPRLRPGASAVRAVIEEREEGM